MNHKKNHKSSYINHYFFYFFCRKGAGSESVNGTHGQSSSSSQQQQQHPRVKTEGVDGNVMENHDEEKISSVVNVDNLVPNDGQVEVRANAHNN